jgi:predicted nuclease with TOPRIM domain
MEDKINAAVTIKKDYERLQTTDLVRENKELTVALDEIFDSFDFAQERISNLQKENDKLIYENRDLKSLVDDLRRDIGSIYKNTREFLEARVSGVRAFKETLGSWVDKVKAKTVGDDLERSHKREERKERNKGMER